MPHTNLTQLAAERLRAPVGKAVVHWDTNLAGFCLRVSPKGRKTFYSQYRVKGGREAVEKIGTMDLLSVAEARQLARQSMILARQGVNPVEQRKQQQAAAEAEATASVFTFAVLADQYMRDHLERNTKPSTVREIGKLLRTASAFFGSKPVRDISRADVLELIAERPPVAANNLLAIVKRVFRWALDRDLVEDDPVLVLKKPYRQQARERVLSDDEIVAFWHACDKIGWPFGPLFQLLLLTGQRRDEVAGMRWSELDLDNAVWHLPPATARNKASRTKNGRSHDVHLSEQALGIIASLHRFKPEPGKPDFVFSFDGRQAVTGFGVAKRRVAEVMNVSDWTLHDLRRTCTTGMARLGIPPMSRTAC